MSLTWRDEQGLTLERPGPLGIGRAVLRGVPLFILLGIGLAALFVVRALEWLVVSRRRPWTPWIPVLVCRMALRLLGLRTQRDGTPMCGAGAFVANHASWLDVFVLNAQAPMLFTAKAEVAGWPGIGWLARATGTIFIRREARGEVPEQARAIVQRMGDGDRPVIFAEGTSTDNRRVLPFRSGLLSGLCGPNAPSGARLQPVTLAYEAPPQEDPRFYAWYGDAEFAPHAIAVLAARHAGRVRITFHEPIYVKDRNRKTLAAEAEARVRAAL